jgi:ribosome recycling factor
VKELFNSALSAVAPYLVQILLGVIALLFILAGIQTARLAWAKKELQVSQAQNDTFAVKILAQNQAIQQWQEEAKSAEHRAEQAQQAAAKIRTESTRKVARLQAEPVPTDCIAAAQWAAGKATELAEGWK